MIAPAELRRTLADPNTVLAALGLLEGSKRRGREYSILCPVHNERVPSCLVRVGRDGTLQVRCQACKFAGDVFHLIAAREQLDCSSDFGEVLERAEELAGGVERPLFHRAPPPPLVTTAAFAPMAKALLQRCPIEGEAGVYLCQRGILFQAQQSGWGEIPADLEERLAVVAWLREAHPVACKAVLRADLREFRWPDHRLLIPWEHDGLVFNLQARRLQGAEEPKYVFPPRRAYEPAVRYPYGYQLGEVDQVWIVEGAVDAEALRALNFNGKQRNLAVFGLPGVGSWKALRSAIGKAACGQRVAIGLDNDRAGEEAVQEMVRDLLAFQVREVVRVPPKGAKDWGEIASQRLWYNETNVRRHERRVRERLA